MNGKTVRAEPAMRYTSAIHDIGRRPHSAASAWNCWVE